MKATASLSPSKSSTAPAEKALLQVLGELVKARLTFLVLLTTAVGFYLGWRGTLDGWLLAHTLLGTALVACGAAALNQLSEREHDARMRRTADRPLPSGRLQPETVLILGGASSVVGLIYLALAVNALTSLLGAVTLGSYLFVYTPLKRVTWLNTAVGAVPGALPPLMGWTAARGQLSGEGWALFGILFFWQIPHFLAIAWLYREEYEKAGFVMLPSVDRGGVRTGRQAVSHTMGLLIVSLTPFLLHLTGVVYVCGALLLGAIFLVCAAQFSRQLTAGRARQLFFASILYLPLLLGLMVLDKLKY
ncbi:MAG TPA: heme o synthase [Verrucomicrobiae bacterium]|nr:heme o synthase [Verrucomicrobiae bacterium]